MLAVPYLVILRKWLSRDGSVNRLRFSRWRLVRQAMISGMMRPWASVRRTDFSKNSMFPIISAVRCPSVIEWQAVRTGRDRRINLVNITHRSVCFRWEHGPLARMLEMFVIWFNQTPN